MLRQVQLDSGLYSCSAGAGASDWADGYAAKHWGTSSVLGSYLDPLADKALVGCTVGALAAEVQPRFHLTHACYFTEHQARPQSCSCAWTLARDPLSSCAQQTLTDAGRIAMRNAGVAVPKPILPGMHAFSHVLWHTDPRRSVACTLRYAGAPQSCMSTRCHACRVPCLSLWQPSL